MVSNASTIPHYTTSMDSKKASAYQARWPDTRRDFDLWLMYK